MSTRRISPRTVLAAAVWVSSLGFTVTSARADDSALAAVRGILAQRHFAGNTSTLESAAGGKSNLIQILIQLRHDNNTPFAAVRAEKLLIDYSDDPAAQAALKEDLQNPQMKGLARAIVVHIDSVKSDSVRQEMARMAMNRAKTESDLEPYIRQFDSSSDPVVRSIGSGK